MSKSSFERRLLIADHIKTVRHETLSNLVSEFGVCRRTIINDIEELIVIGYPIQTISGRGGGIIWDASYRADESFTKKQLVALKMAAALLPHEEARVIEDLIRQREKAVHLTVYRNDLFEILADMSQRDLARRLGVSESFISKVLAGAKSLSQDLATKVIALKGMLKMEGQADESV